MTISTAGSLDLLEARARATHGSSADAILRMVARALDARSIRGGTLIDVGCGRGDLRRALGDRFDRYVGLDAVRYDTLPEDVDFRPADLDSTEWSAADLQGDVVAAVETIEHLENPWAFARALVRIARPGAWVVMTTPNQLSVLSLLTLLTKQRFSAFQDAMYPVHRTALLESDLAHAARAAGLDDLAIDYSREGRVPLSGVHFPGVLSRRWPRRFSDNVLVIGRRPV